MCEVWRSEIVFWGGIFGFAIKVLANVGKSGTMKMYRICEIVKEDVFVVSCKKMAS